MSLGQLYGAVEAGGTKFLCVVGRDPEHLVDQTRIETTSPEETLGKVGEFFLPYTSDGKIEAIGIGCFGPLDTRPDSPTYGFITTTPKPGWGNTPLVSILGDALQIRLALDTDVNAAALGEFTWGASQGADPSLYVTMGTGIGGGLIYGGRPFHGLTHPEMGHIRVRREPDRDAFAGSCVFHGDCFEGLASGPAIEKRFGRRANELLDADPFWQVEAGYIASALSTYVLTVSPRKIILGGGLMQRSFMFPVIRRKLQEALNGYVQATSVLGRMDRYVVPPALGTRSGVLGALAMVTQPAGASRV